MAKFIEFDGWEYNDGGRVDMHLVVNIDHIVKMVNYHSENYVNGIECTLSNDYTFYVSEDTHRNILEQLDDNC